MTEYWINEQMTIEQAVKFIKQQRGRSMKLFISVVQEAMLVGSETKCFPILGNAEVTQKVAIGFVQTAYKNFEARGARITIRALGKCIFIG